MEPVKQDMDTVALLCIGVVTKEEYDSMQVEDVSPVVVKGKSGATVRLKPVMIVGSVDATLESALSKIEEVWKVYTNRLEAAVNGPQDKQG